MEIFFKTNFQALKGNKTDGKRKKKLKIMKKTNQLEDQLDTSVRTAFFFFSFILWIIFTPYACWHNKKH